MSLRFLCVGPTPGLFPISDFSCPPKKVSNPFCTYIFSNEYFFLLTAAILKGDPLLRMRWGVGCWQPERRLPPSASNRLRSFQTAPPSMLQSYKEWKNGNNTKWPIHIEYFFVCTSSTIQSVPVACFLLRTGLHVSLILPFLIWVAKTSSLLQGQFLNLVRKVSLLFSFGSFLFVGLIYTRYQVYCTVTPWWTYLAYYMQNPVGTCKCGPRLSNRFHVAFSRLNISYHLYIYIQYYCLTNQNSSWESGSFCPQFRSTLITCTL